MTKASPKSVLVVGAGIVGASIAYHSARAGLDVTIVDRTGPHAGASGRSWAWINAMASADPDYYALRRAGVSAWQELDQAIAQRLEIDWNGCLIWDPQLVADDAVNRLRLDWGANIKMLEGDSILAEIPALAPGAVSRALLSLDDGLVDGAHATSVLLEEARTLGATLMFGPMVTQLSRDERGTVLGVETDFGPLRSDYTFIAAGTGCRDLLSPVGFSLPVAHRPGLLVTTRPVMSGILRRAFWGPKIHVKQLRDGRLVIGNTAKGPPAATPPDGLAQRMLTDACEILPGLGTLEIDRMTVATRPIPRDGMPAIGPIPDAPGLYLATMHSGFTLAAVAGKLLTEEILGKPPSALLEAFRPVRFT